MIPFDILSGEIVTEDKIKAEIRVLELSPDSFSFRLPFSYLNAHGQIEKINLSFFSRETGEYEDLTIEKFSFELISRDDFSETFLTKTNDKWFCILSKKLTHEYLEYIDLKTNYSDEELSYNLTGHSLNTDDFCSDISEQMINWEKELQDEKNDYSCLSSINEFVISLENSELYELFLNSNKADFIKQYFKRWNMEEHILAKCKYSRILVGNPYCINLFPDEPVLIRIMEKARLLGLNVTVVLPPVSQTHFDKMCELLKRILSESLCEIQVNDIGTASCIKDYYPNAEVTKGPLLCKERRDPRKAYSMQYRNREYTNLMIDEKSVYYPFYQTNTGTFCPLYATVKNGNRGKQERVLTCGNICDCNHFIYPRNLNLIGKYNSLLGFEKRINACRERLVINLW